jgi:hypothetical protein
MQQRHVTTPPPSQDVQPSRSLRDTGSKGLSEPGERTERSESSLQQLDSSNERNATRRAQQVVRTASVQPSTKPSTSSPPLNRPSASASPLPPLPLAVQALTNTTSSQVHAAHSVPPDGSQTRSGGAPLELPYHRSEERGNAPPDEQSRMNPPATPHRLPSLPGDHTAAATEPPSQSQPVSPPPRLDKSNSRREAKRATEGPTSDKKEQKGIPAPEEYETRDSTTTPDGAKRRKGGLNPPTSYNPKGIQDANASVERTYSSNSSRGNDSSALRLSEIGKSRGKVEQPSASTPSLVKETIFTTPPPSSPSTLKETIFTAPSSVSTSSQPKHVTRVPSNSDVIVSRVEQKPHRARPPTVADSQIKSTPSSKSPTFLTAEIDF